MSKKWVNRDGEVYVSGLKLGPTPRAKISPQMPSSSSGEQCGLQQSQELSPRKRESRERMKAKGSRLNLNSLQVV